MVSFLDRSHHEDTPCEPELTSPAFSLKLERRFVFPIAFANHGFENRPWHNTWQEHHNGGRVDSSNLHHRKVFSLVPLKRWRSCVSSASLCLREMELELASGPAVLHTSVKVEGFMRRSDAACLHNNDRPQQRAVFRAPGVSPVNRLLCG